MSTYFRRKISSVVFCGLVILCGLGSPEVLAADPFAKVKLSPAAQRYLVLKDVNVRVGPETKSKRIGRLRKRELVKAVGKAQGTDWVAVLKNGKNFGFVYGTALVPMIDGALSAPISGNLAARTVGGRKLPPCHYQIQFESKMKVQGVLQITSDYLLGMECDYKKKTIKIKATMFVTELPYLDIKKPIYQINVDLFDIQMGDEDVFSATVLYNVPKKVIVFDGVNKETLRAKGKIATKNVSDLPAALKGAVAMAYQSWGAKIWDQLAQAKRQ